MSRKPKRALLCVALQAGRAAPEAGGAKAPEEDPEAEWERYSACGRGRGGGRDVHGAVLHMFGSEAEWGKCSSKGWVNKLFPHSLAMPCHTMALASCMDT
jgi:hypothetical protein